MNCIDQIVTDDYALYHGDCCEVVKALPDNSMDLLIYSPPFVNLYIYSDSIRDMGNCASDTEFFEHYSFLASELLRITRPGRLCVVHCKDLVDYQGRDGRAGLRDFPGELIRAHEAAGWKYHSRVTIWKCPVTEMQRTKSHGLLHKQLCKDSTFSRQGLPDYLVVFRKWAEGDDDAAEVVPVTGEGEDARFDYYVGTEGPQLSEGQTARDRRGDSIKIWQRYASPVWFDIDQMNVLNVQQARGSQDEKHICPLQLDVIERCVHLWSNPNDVVFTPFMGIGSEVYSALKHNRRGCGVELKDEYFQAAKRNVQSIMETRKQQSLFADELALV
jgi:hypothetical protein